MDSGEYPCLNPDEPGRPYHVSPFDEDDDDDTNMVYVTYNSSNGSYLGSASDENGLEVTGYSDPSTGITYSKYRVTSCNYDWDTFSVELTGIAPVYRNPYRYLHIQPAL